MDTIVSKHFIENEIEEQLFSIQEKIRKVIFKNQSLKDEREKSSKKNERQHAMFIEIILSKDKAKCLVEEENEILNTTVKNLTDEKVENEKLIKEKVENENLLRRMLRKKKI